MLSLASSSGVGVYALIPTPCPPKAPNGGRPPPLPGGGNKNRCAVFTFPALGFDAVGVDGNANAGLVDEEDEAERCRWWCSPVGFGFPTVGVASERSACALGSGASMSGMRNVRREGRCGRKSVARDDSVVESGESSEEADAESGERVMVAEVMVVRVRRNAASWACGRLTRDYTI